MGAPRLDPGQKWILFGLHSDDNEEEQQEDGEEKEEQKGENNHPLQIWMFLIKCIFPDFSE